MGAWQFSSACHRKILMTSLIQLGQPNVYLQIWLSFTHRKKNELHEVKLITLSYNRCHSFQKCTVTKTSTGLCFKHYVCPVGADKLLSKKKISDLCIKCSFSSMCSSSKTYICTSHKYKYAAIYTGIGPLKVADDKTMLHIR